MMKVSAIPAFKDNYIWLIEHKNQLAVVDPGDAQAVTKALNNRKLDSILITHKHYDHTGGVKALVKQHNCTVLGPDCADNDIITIIGLEFRVFSIPGHTLDHIAFYGHGLLFCGDTLFSAGCGRVFEGSMQQMYDSLQRLKALPDDTLVYCAHEYTQANLAFALSIFSNDSALLSYDQQVKNLIAAGAMTLPTTIAREKQINVFLRCNNLQSFIKLRNLKDNYVAT